ncbi:HlyD family efflux transporter periplasmic adaptor subunit [Aerosakkonema funiforme]|uniref:HlyD family efflux transporter periplasmic adaptor subunit n=1 Tax=Aerosakkonema funiforme TaxID=1246630 RepID=UPI0035B7A3EA
MSNSTSNNSPNRIQLKVVPPASTPQPEIARDRVQDRETAKSKVQNAKLPEGSPQQPVKSTSSFNYGRLLLIAGLIAGGVWVAQMPIPNSVRTEAKLEPLPNSHRFVYMAIPGTVTKFWVNSGDAVKVGNPVATVSAVDLESEIIQKTAKLQEQESAKAAATVRIPIVQSKVEEAIDREVAAQRQVEEVRQDLVGINQGNPTPEIEKLQAEIKALNSRIPGIEAEIVSLRSNLVEVEKSIANYERPELNELMARIPLQDKLKELKTQKFSIQGEVSSKEQEIQAIEHQVEAKFDEIESCQQKLQRDLGLRQDELDSKVAIKKTAIQELAAAKAEVANLTPAIETLRTELRKLQEKQQKNQMLLAPISGIIFSQNLHEKVGRKMGENEAVLEIAALDKLVALIEVAQSDSDLVKEMLKKPSATVVLQPLEPGLKPITTKIEKIEPVLQTDPSGQKQLLRVRAIVDNKDNIFQPNAKFYAQIEVESIPLYQRVQRELMKLFQIRKYV